MQYIAQHYFESYEFWIIGFKETFKNNLKYYTQEVLSQFIVNLTSKPSLIFGKEK